MKTRKIAALSTVVGLVLAGTLAAQEQGGLDDPVRLQAGGEWIDTGTDVGHAGPLFRDQDGDGLPDLLVSSFRGNIRFFKNVGTRSAPEFEEREPLQAEGEPIRIHNW